jgi:hypothetical protein
MYISTIQHNFQILLIKWNLEPLFPNDSYNIIFTDFSFTTSSADYKARLIEENTCIGIHYKNIQIAQIHFHSERLIYFLQFIQSDAIVNGFYLENAGEKYTVAYEVMYAAV